MASKSYKNSNGWMLQGQCFQWMIDNKDLSVNEKNVYSKILRQSFGFKHRWCYLKYKDFDIKNSSSLKKILDKLKDLGIISYKHTFKENGHRGLNEYRIEEPSGFIRNFIFKENVNDSSKKTNQECELNEEEELRKIGW